MVCHQCGSPVFESHKSCTNCGAELARVTRRLESASKGLRRMTAEIKALDLAGRIFPPGERIAARFTLGERLGEGPLGQTYKAHDGEADTDVVVKVFAADIFATPIDQERFVQATRAARTQNHKHLARLHDSGVHKDRAWVSMEHLEGLNLRKVLNLRKTKKEFFSVTELEPIVEQIVEALQQLHRQSPHTDLKPENIIFLPELIKITDSYLATALDGTVLRKKLDGSSYRAPELHDHAAEASAVCDVYSLGMILGEMYFGPDYVPGGHTPQNSEEGAIDALVRRATAFDPHERFGSVEALSEEFLAIVDTARMLRGRATSGEQGAVPRAGRRTQSAPVITAMGMGPVVRPAAVSSPPDPLLEETPFDIGDPLLDEIATTERRRDASAEAPLDAAIEDLAEAGLSLTKGSGVDGAEPPTVANATSKPPSAPAGPESTKGKNQVGNAGSQPKAAPKPPAKPTKPVAASAPVAPKASDASEPVVPAAPPALASAERSDSRGLMGPLAIAAIVIVCIAIALSSGKDEVPTEARLQSAQAPAAANRPEPAEAVAEPEPSPAPSPEPSAPADPEPVVAAPVKVTAVPPVAAAVPPVAKAPKAPTASDTAAKPGAKAAPVVAASQSPTAEAAAPASGSRCPSGMLLVKARGGNYCVDAHEYPGRGATPKSQVSWFDAQRTCTEQSKRLCTTSEWRGACGSAYPYGSSFQPDTCNTADADGFDRSLAKAGSKPKCKSRSGAFDMSGNVLEWTQEQKIAGGGFDADASTASCRYASPKAPGSTAPNIGFRCCADPQ